MAAGARICATLWREMLASSSREKAGSQGVSKGGRLKEAKMVRESRRAKSA